MTTYTTSDFSPIFGPDEKPVRPGWYLANEFFWSAACWAELIPTNGIPAFMFDEFRSDGKWYAVDGIKHYDQNRYWFGLNKKP